MSTNDPSFPLTTAHLANIQTSLQVLDKLDAAIAQAERAGINVSAQKAQAQDSRTKLLQIKNVYFPNT